MAIDTKQDEMALDALLRALIAHRDSPRSEQQPLRIIKASDLAKMPIPTRAECELKHLLRDPIGAALRQGIRRIGEHLFEVSGNTDAMRGAIERVAEMDDAHYSYRAYIMDHAWSDIGRDGDRWCC